MILVRAGAYPSPELLPALGLIWFIEPNIASSYPGPDKGLVEGLSGASLGLMSGGQLHGWG